MLKRVLVWLLVAAVCYPLGCCGFVATCGVTDAVAVQEPQRVLARVPEGATPSQVEAAVGRPAEDVVHYYSAADTDQYSHNWTVNGYRLEVIFVNGRSADRHLFHPDAGPVREFLTWVFFWWLAGAVSD